jgi:hypothetical protein
MFRSPFVFFLPIVLVLQTKCDIVQGRWVLNDEIEAVLEAKQENVKIKYEARFPVHCNWVKHLAGLYLIIHNRSKTHDAEPDIIGRFTQLIFLDFTMQTLVIRSSQSEAFESRRFITVLMTAVF